jgi:SSS family solute:Na+ symporter
MAHFLPIGIKGLLATIFLFFSFTSHDTYMHSWGSIFVQDVYMPLRKKALTPEQHIKLLRWSIIGVAVFSFLFSLFYQPSEKIFFFFAITGTIWAGGSGAVILGGLYWKRGTTAAAFCALTVGAVVGVGGLIIPKMYKASHGVDFPINNQWLWFMAMVSAALIYILVSLLFPAKEREYNLERMLHRGRYRIKEDHVAEEEVRSRWQQIVGITREFSRGDRILALALVAWNATWFTWFVVFSVVNLFFPVSDMAWARYWHVQAIIIPCVLSVPATIWFTIGGVHDIRALFESLKTATRDVNDDGRVRGWREPDDELATPVIAGSDGEA